MQQPAKLTEGAGLTVKFCCRRPVFLDRSPLQLQQAYLTCLKNSRQSKSTREPISLSMVSASTEQSDLLIPLSTWPDPKPIGCSQLNSSNLTDICVGMASSLALTDITHTTVWSMASKVPSPLPVTQVKSGRLKELLPPPESLIWSMECLLSLSLTDITLLTDCSDLLVMTSNPSDWPAFASELNDFLHYRASFIFFELKHIPRSANARADSLAKCARTRGFCFSHVNSTVPDWFSLAENH